MADDSTLRRLSVASYGASRPGSFDGEIASLIARVDSAYSFGRFAVQVDLTVARALNGFAVRMASLAVRKKDPAWIRYGLVAAQLAMVGDDPRDILPTYSVLYRAAEIVGVDAGELFSTRSYLSKSPDQETPAEFASRRPEDRSIKVMGYVESNDKKGFSFRQRC